MFTFWDYFRQHWQRDAGLRIDHLLLNADLAPRLLDAGVDRWVRGLEGTSDHAPTWITFTGERGQATLDDYEMPAIVVEPTPTTATKKRARKPKR
jgi:exodeoxyribonuclease-3